MACHVKIYRTGGILNEVTRFYRSSGWTFCLQRVRYHYEDGSFHDGYRFIWRMPGGNLQPSRGQARIPSLRIMREMMAESEKEGWGHFDADTDDCLFEELEEETV